MSYNRIVKVINSGHLGYEWLKMSEWVRSFGFSRAYGTIYDYHITPSFTASVCNILQNRLPIVFQNGQ
jgi:hypothetical protein